MSVATDKPPVYVRFQPETRRALDELADKDGRSLSNFLERIAIEWLNGNGYPDLKMRGPKRRERRKQ